jgi:tripartite ATP-independent transporter DctM subunit
MELFFLAVLVLLMIVALGSGYPVAFALPGSAILAIALAAISGQLYADDPSAFFAQGGPVQWLSAGVTNFRGIYWEAERDTLIAIPLFIFMGIMLQRSKIAEDLLVTMAQLFGPIPGGLGISVVFVGALLAATTGIVGATVVAMGLISLPAMLQRNYSKPLATGTIAASGTLGQIIPPSIVLIILVDQLSSAVDQAGTARKEFFKVATGELSMPSEFDIISTSAGDMFLGALVPGLVLVGLYMAFILIFALIKPSAAPPVPFEGKMDRRFVGNVLLILVPPLALIFLVLGSIIAGIATVNQAGAIGAVGALIMAGYRLKPGRKDTFAPAILGMISLVVVLVVTSIYDTNIKNIQSTDDVIGVTLAVIAVFGLIVSIVWSGWRAYKIEDTLQGVMIDTAKTTSLVFIILLGAAMLTAAFRSFGGEELVREFLNGMPGGFWSKFVIVMAVKRHGSVVRRYDRAEHPNLVPDPAIRLCAVLFARCRAAQRQDAGNVQGRDRLHRFATGGIGNCRQLSGAGQLPAKPGVANLRNSTPAAEPAAAILHGGVYLRTVRRERRHAARRDRESAGIGL